MRTAIRCCTDMKFLEKLNNTDIELTALTIWIARKPLPLNRVEFYEARAA